MNRTAIVSFLTTGILVGLSVVSLGARQANQATKPVVQPPPTAASQDGKARTAPRPIAPIVTAVPVVLPPGYVIGPDDLLQVLYWREKDMSAEVTVRPDGMITLPLLNDIEAAGLSPDQLRDRINELSKKFLQEEPTVTVVVKAINSRKVFIIGSINRPGAYPLTSPTTVLQLIATAGGLAEFADQTKVAVMRQENGKVARYMFNYKDVARGKNLEQNIELKPGDTVIVP